MDAILIHPKKYPNSCDDLPRMSAKVGERKGSPGFGFRGLSDWAAAFQTR